MKRVAVIEENDSLGMKLIGLLTRHHEDEIEWILLANLEDVDDHIRKTSFDFIFCNTLMGKTTGLHLLCIIKSSKWNRRSKVYLYAEQISEEVNKLARLLRAAGCIELATDEQRLIRYFEAILAEKLIPSYAVFKAG